MGLKHTNFVWYLDQAVGYVTDYPEQRLGQAYFNIFRIMYPQYEHEIFGTEFDCFHDNSKLPGFLTWVQAKLDMRDDPKYDGL